MPKKPKPKIAVTRWPSENLLRDATEIELNYARAAEHDEHEQKVTRGRARDALIANLVAARDAATQIAGSMQREITKLEQEQADEDGYESEAAQFDHARKL